MQSESPYAKQSDLDKDRYKLKHPIILIKVEQERALIDVTHHRFAKLVGAADGNNIHKNPHPNQDLQKSSEQAKQSIHAMDNRKLCKKV